MNEPQRKPVVRAPWQPRFTLGAILLVTTVVCVTAAAGSYMVQAFQTDAPASRKLFFVMFTLVAPVVVLIVARLGRMLFVRLLK